MPDFEQMTDAELDKFTEKAEVAEKACKAAPPGTQSAMTVIDWATLALELWRRWRTRGGA